MAIKPEMIEYIRTMVRGDYDANDRVESKLDEEGWEGFSRLLGAVFFFAVDRRFGGKLDERQIIKFVAEMRSDVPSGGPAIDAAAAETLVKAALDPDVQFDIDPHMVGQIQALAILKILSDPPITDDDLESLLEDATELASRMQ